MKSLIIMLSLFCLPWLSSAQTTIKGVVKGDKEVLIGANVVLYDANETIIAYGMTDVDGKYEIKTEKLQGDHKLEASYFSFRTQSLALNATDLSKNQLTHDFNLETDIQTIGEVVIASTFLEKDTVVFELEKLNLDDDDKLRDILERIPSFNVSNDGAIVYDGKSIEKILVNDNLNFVGQNKIALDNIETRTIEDISVIKNYSNDFELDFDDIEETVINIKTKSTDKLIVDGTVEAKYGISNKYQVSGNSFLFSKKFNAFLVTNTNNIGYTDFDEDELTSLLSRDNAPSMFQINGINRLFSTDEFLEKNFVNNSNMTIRKQGDRFRLSAILYYLKSDRSLTSNSAVYSSGNELLASDSLANKSQIPAFLGSANIDFKLTPRTIISYKMNQTFVDDQNQSQNVTNVLSGQSSNRIEGQNQKRIYAGYYNAKMATKWHPKAVFKSDVTYASERVDFNNTALVDNSITVNNQQGILDSRSIRGRANLKHNSFTRLTNSANFEFLNKDEGVQLVAENGSSTRRNINEYLGEYELNGLDLLNKKLDVDLNLGVNYISSGLNDEKSSADVFIPAIVSLRYKRKLKTYTLDFERKKEWNDLSFATNLYTHNNEKVIGTDSLIAGYNHFEKLKLRYEHNDVFTGKSLLIDFGFQINRNEAVLSFLGFEDYGTSVWTYFMSDKNTVLNLDAKYTQRISEMSFPALMTLKLKTKRQSFPRTENIQSTTHRNTFSPEISYKSLTKKTLNFRYNSVFSYNIDQTTTDAFTSYVSNNSLAIIAKHKQFKSEVSFIYDFGKINDRLFHRKNINLELSLTKNKTTFSMDIVHLGELFGLYENTSYNTYSIIENGRNTLTTNNQALKYLMLGIKYNY